MEKWKAILYGLDFDKSAYVKCLGYPEISKRQEEDKKHPESIIESESGNPVNTHGQRNEVYEHQCFRQIEKDLDRTFRFP